MNTKPQSERRVEVARAFLTSEQYRKLQKLAKDTSRSVSGLMTSLAEDAIRKVKA
jgi:hypothetical protein